MINKIKKAIKNRLYREIEEKDIDLQEAKQLQKDGAIIVDVRSPQEYREGHIDGSISIPEYEIKKEIENMIVDKNKNIVVYCSSGGRSKKAQKTLNTLGYKNVYNIYEGYFIQKIAKFYTIRYNLNQRLFTEFVDYSKITLEENDEK